MYDNNANTQDNANIQISADILNLLVIQGEVDDFDTVMGQLRADYAADADAAKDCDPGFVVPASLPATCAGGEADAVLELLNQLAVDTSDALCFEAYVQSVLDGSCGTAHLAKIAELEEAFNTRIVDKTPLIEELHAVFAADQPLDLYGEFLEAGYHVAVLDGTYVGVNELQDEKPVVPADCEAFVGDYNLEIDGLAEDLKIL